ncbi:C-C chemokine receptor type 3-like [Nelusetta ayraudi]|uniref:C-C chemokine receptor type 3-like n=1 Tax=Nelusetta ayraudi TaxID=303726 RepID=UPI003F72943A
MSGIGEEYSSTHGYYDDYQLSNVIVSPCNNASTFGIVFLPTVYCLVFILSFIGNGLVVCVLVKHRKQTNLTDICLFNLALADLLFALTLPLHTHYAVIGEWVFGDFVCCVSKVSHAIGFFGSVFFIMVMTLDRYVVILHPLTGGWYRTLGAGVAITVSVWTLSLTVSLPALIFSKVTNETYGKACRYAPENNFWNTYQLFADNILGLALPLMVMAGCYSRIIPKLVTMKSAKKYRVVRLIITIMVTFFLFWTPYNIYLVLEYLKNEGVFVDTECTLDSSLKLANVLTVALAYTHCCLNPFLYAFVGQRFAKRVLQLLRSWIPSGLLPHFAYVSESSSRRSSVMSRSSEVVSTFIK